MEPARSGPGTEGRGNRPDGVVVPESSKAVNQERPLGLRRTAHQARVERATAFCAEDPVGGPGGPCGDPAFIEVLTKSRRFIADLC
jgi:hypothetical protein